MHILHARGCLLLVFCGRLPFYANPRRSKLPPPLPPKHKPPLMCSFVLVQHILANRIIAISTIFPPVVPHTPQRTPLVLMS